MLVKMCVLCCRQHLEPVLMWDLQKQTMLQIFKAKQYRSLQHHHWLVLEQVLLWLEFLMWHLCIILCPPSLLFQLCRQSQLTYLPRLWMKYISIIQEHNFSSMLIFRRQIRSLTLWSMSTLRKYFTFLIVLTSRDAIISNMVKTASVQF